MQIRPLVIEDRDQWLPLWQQYLDFYRQPLASEITEFTFQRLCQHQELAGLVAEMPDGRLAGFVTLLFHPSTWSIHGYCYVEDLLVDAEFRGQGIARALLDAAGREADGRRCTRVYWFTQQDNRQARRLYDSVGHVTPYVIYRRGPAD